MLGALEPVGRFALLPQTGQLRPLLEGLRHHVRGIGGRAGRQRFLVQLVDLLLVEPQGRVSSANAC
jgi:hypothetical protein